MNWTTIEKVAENPNKQWYYNQGELAVILGRNRQLTAAFLIEHSIPYYSIGKSKMYFLPEVLEAVENERWKS